MDSKIVQWEEYNPDPYVYHVRPVGTYSTNEYANTITTDIDQKNKDAQIIPASASAQDHVLSCLGHPDFHPTFSSFCRFDQDNSPGIDKMMLVLVTEYATVVAT
jgi:hypothetical protein